MEKFFKPSDLLNPMLLSIWEISGGVPYKEVPLKEVLNNTIIKLGLDPKKEKLGGPDGWSLKLRMLFRSYMEGVTSTNPAYVSLLGYGKWSLTNLGVEYLKSIYNEPILSSVRPQRQKEPNLTSKWLDVHGNDLYKFLLKNLSKSLKMSATLGSIEDHIQTFYVKIIANDALKPYLTENRKISFSMLNAWAVRSAYSEFTTMGQEPVERVMRNAKTETELNIEKKIPQESTNLFDFGHKVSSAPGLNYDVLVQNSDSDAGSMHFETDTFDFELYSLDNQEDQLLDKMSFSKTFSALKFQVSEAFSRSKDQNLAMRILDDMILTNKSIQEIAESNSTATSKIYSIMNKIREEGFKAYKKGHIEI